MANGPDLVVERVERLLGQRNGRRRVDRRHLERWIRGLRLAQRVDQPASPVGRLGRVFLPVGRTDERGLAEGSIGLEDCAPLWRIVEREAILDQAADGREL